MIINLLFKEGVRVYNFEWRKKMFNFGGMMASSTKEVKIIKVSPASSAVQPTAASGGQTIQRPSVNTNTDRALKEGH